MQLIHSVAELRARLAQEKSVAFVPTMGNLHEGHLELVRMARNRGKLVVASIFVNPLQFGPNEDFDQYPRTLDADCAKLANLTDVVFAPSVAEMYPEPQTLFVEPPPIANELCGAFRPGHFRGMATVVLKLFNQVQPQVAIFGKKDYQQLMVIRNLVRELNLPIEIVAGETVRAADGLALSSRNGYLNDAELLEAPRLFRILTKVIDSVRQGAKNFQELERGAISELQDHGWIPDYVALRKKLDLQLPSAHDFGLVVVAAARLGSTRLIDNLEV